MFRSWIGAEFYSAGYCWVGSGPAPGGTKGLMSDMARQGGHEAVSAGPPADLAGFAECLTEQELEVTVNVGV